MNAPTALAYSPIFLTHQTAAGHPESPARLTAALALLERQPWYPELLQVPPEPASAEWLQEIHTPAYLARAEQACLDGQPYLDTPDVSISTDSWTAALHAAGAGLVLADAVLEGRARNGFGLLRPPGHHAEADAALGFCLLNNIAILARYLQRRHGLGKVLILDWDVHHGNGTQHSFEADPTVMYVSLHQYPYYPGTGAPQERGTGPGIDSIINCPMPAGAGNAEYIQAFEQRILPAMGSFQPEFVLISAGFDAHYRDPLANIRLDTAFYRWMSLRIMEVADQYADGRLISLLEGGYHHQALAECIATHLHTLSDSSAELQL